METKLPVTVIPRGAQRAFRRPVSIGIACAIVGGGGCETLSSLHLGSKAPTADECASADENAQALRQNAKLRAARQQLQVCLDSSCPAPVRDDCTERLAEVTKATPSIILDAKDGAGISLTAVRVVMDDTALVDHLDGTPIVVDPGKHRFTFTMANASPVEKEAVIREAEKGQFVVAVFPLRASGAGADAGAGGPSASVADEQKAAARLLATEGLNAAIAGDCVRAVDKLTRAEALVHAPTTAVPLAQCEMTLGKPVTAADMLTRVLREAPPPTAPKSWTDARSQAPALLATAQSRIAKLRIHVERAVDAGVASDTEITIDGEAVLSTFLDADRPIDPGKHHVTARASGFAPAETDVTLADGQSQRVSLRLDVPQASGMAAPDASAFGGDEVVGAVAHAEVGSARSRVPAYVALGIGGAGLLIGSVYGVLALQAKSRLDSACQGTVCPTSSQGDIDAFHTDPVVSTVGLGVGFVGAAVGTYFWLTTRSDKPTASGRLTIRPLITPRSVGIAGTFL